jgi:hypothetical protein
MTKHSLSPTARHARLAACALSLLGLAPLGLGLTGCGGAGRLAPSYVAVHNTMTAMGLAQSGEISEGVLGQGEVARLSTPLRGGGCYTLAAFGGDGVGDIDIAVADPSGEVLASDRAQGSQAATQVCPPRDGNYQVSVTMVRGGGSYLVTSWSGSARGAGASSGGGGGRGTCDGPIALTLGTAVRGSTTQGSHGMSGSCIQGGAAPEVVYSFTLEQRAQISAVLNSAYDGALYLLGRCGDLETEIACNDDAPTTARSEVGATLDAGTYFLVVDGFANAAGEYELLVTATELQSLAQVCQAATPLTPGQAVTGSTATQANYFTATCAGGARSPDRVYSLDVPARSRLRVRMQSTYDGAIYVRSDCQSPNTELACNDDHRDTRHAMLVTTVDPGRYYVYADGFSASSAGDYSLRADLAPLTGGSAPADACAAPGTVTPGQELTFDTFVASDELSGSCGGQGAPDLVYRLDVPSRMRLRARMLDSEFAGAMYIQRQCGVSTSEVACSSSGPNGTELDVNLQPGQYFLVIDGAGADQFGAARVEVQLEDLQALEAVCRSAPRIRAGRTVTGDTASGQDRFQATCGGGARSADLVYQLQVPRRSRVRITSTQQYDGALYIRRDCADPTTEVACNDDTSDNRHSEIDTVLDAGTYFVFVDGFADSSQGSFTLDVELTRP